MSWDVIGDEESLGQFASNMGYSDLIEAADRADALTLQDLFETGESDEVDTVIEELKALSGSDDVKRTANGLADLIKGHESILISDGMTGDDGVEKDDDDDDEGVEKAGSGIMLALWPDPEIQDELAVPGGEAPWDIHLTLAYFGKDVEDYQYRAPVLEESLRLFAATHAPVSGTITGIGLFPATTNSDGKDVAYRGFHSPEIRPFRKELVELTSQAGMQHKTDFEFSPHITLKYISPSAPHLLPHPPNIPATFDRIVLSVGGEKKEFLLTGEPALVDPPLEPATGNDFELSGDIVKVDKVKHLVFGWFSIVEVNGKAVVDTQGDIIDTDVLEESAYEFVLTARTSGEMHERENGTVRGVGRLVESVVFTPEKLKAMRDSLEEQGIECTLELNCIAWWGGFHIDSSDTWDSITAGKLKAWSIGGTGKRAALD